MPRHKKLRRRPSTPNLKVYKNGGRRHTAGPASPPETPTTSPVATRKTSLKQRHQAPYHEFALTIANDPNIRPVGGGHQFSYQPGLGPEHLSPQESSSSSSSEDGAEQESDNASSESGSSDSSDGASSGQQSGEDDSDNDDDQSSDASDALEGHPAIRITTTTTTIVAGDFTIEDVDPMDSENDDLDIVFPTEIESIRSRSRSRHKDFKDLDRGMMNDLRNLNCSNEASDDEPEVEPELEHGIFLKRQQELKRLRRVSMSSSIGKRTHSEISDSDDDEDGTTTDVNDMGATARRMRKRLHRTSLLFQDPPEPRIDELDEPDSSEDEFPVDHTLARELPYWTMEINDMDSD